MAIAPPAGAQETANPANPAHPANVPMAITIAPGETLTVRVGDARAAATVVAPAETVAIRVLRNRSGRLVEASAGGAIPYDVPFIIELEFSAAPRFATTEVAIEWVNGKSWSVTLRRLATETRLFRSALLHLRTPGSCEGMVEALGCQ